MRNVITVKDSNNQDMIVELLFNFKIDKLGKEYMVYTINDDNVSETVNIFISEVEYENNIPKIVPIKDDEKEMVLMFYDSIRQLNN